MSVSRSLRPLAAALGIALCAALVQPALADTPVTVTFQPNSHWAQEVNTVDRYDYYHDYSVAIPADKTFQINLVTRDPNVFFKVKDETHDKKLVDTYQTGATTWSTQTTEPTTYSIRVYVQPDAMQRDEKPKYALQIGQYGQNDLQPATTAVTFQDNNPWAQMTGSVDPQAPSHDFTVAIAAGKTLAVNLITENPAVHFTVKDQASGSVLVDTGKTPTTKWSTAVPAAGNYTVSVYAAPTSLPAGQQVKYALQIGQYAGAAAQPAAGGTAAAAPASAASADH
ncbi:MAG: hypothetical protein ACREPH_09085 [Rhodanobacteraceae bacterium]